MSTENQFLGQATPYVQKDIVKVSVPTQSSVEKVQQAIAYIQKYGAPSGPIKPVSTWGEGK